MFRRPSAVLPPSHRRRGATAVLVRHKPQWHRRDRGGSAVVPSLIAVAPPKTVKTADLRGGTAETFNMFKTSAVSPRVGPIRIEVPRHRHDRRGNVQGPQWHLHHRRAPAVAPPSRPCLRSTTAVQSRKCRRATLRRSHGGSTAVKCVTGREILLKIPGGVTTVMAVLIKNRSGTAPPV